MQLPIQVLAHGQFTAQDITIGKVPPTLNLPPDVISLAEKVWQDHSKVGKAVGEAHADPTVYRLETVNATDTTLQLSVSTIPYRLSYALPIIISQQGVSGQFIPKRISIGGPVFISDGQMVLVTKKEHSETEPALDVLAGIIQQAHTELSVGSDLIQALNAVLQAEINTIANDVLEQTIQGIIQNTDGNIAIITSTKLRLSSKELLDRFTQHHDPDIAELLVVPKEEGLAKLTAAGGLYEEIAKLFPGQG